MGQTAEAEGNSWQCEPLFSSVFLVKSSLKSSKFSINYCLPLIVDKMSLRMARGGTRDLEEPEQQTKFY